MDLHTLISSHVLCAVSEGGGDFGAGNVLRLLGVGWLMEAPSVTLLTIDCLQEQHC